MKLINKILHRDAGVSEHEEWLKAHPGKGSMAAGAAPPNAGYDQASREKMERELAAQKEKMAQPK